MPQREEILARTGIIGLQLLGYSGWVQDAFYGPGSWPPSVSRT